MSLWIAVLLFLANILDDALAVLYIRRTAQGKALQSGLISGALTLIVAFSVVNYVQNRIYLIPIAIGSAIGSFLTVKIDKFYQRGKQR